jgi:hypothetical protein
VDIEKFLDLAAPAVGGIASWKIGEFLLGWRRARREDRQDEHSFTGDNIRLALEAQNNAILRLENSIKRLDLELEAERTARLKAEEEVFRLRVYISSLVSILRSANLEAPSVPPAD